MFQSVELPVWLFVLILLFAGVTFASHFLFPSVRWFFRRRMEHAVARLNERLPRPIEPFKLARRADTIQRLIYDRDVLAAVAEHAKAEGVPEAVAHERAERYAREIVPSFSASAYFGFGTRASKWLSKLIYKVRVDVVDEERLNRIDPDAAVVFVMNHRSNMDYVLVTWLVSQRSALSYAVGEWARIWPLSTLIRSMGAFFIRRKSRNALYRKVLARYVQMATQGGVAQAVFPEGGLSLDGKVALPKLGFLNYIVSGYQPGGRDVVFIPVALNYDRVLEDRVLIAADEAGERRFRASIPTALRFTFRQLVRMLRGRFHRFGTAAVYFGAPFSLATFPGGEPQTLTKRVGQELNTRIESVMPVLPVPLIASILQDRGALSRTDLIAETSTRLAKLSAYGARLPTKEESPDEIVDAGLRVLTLRRIVQIEGDLISPVKHETSTVAFYANTIRHLIDRAEA